MYAFIAFTPAARHPLLLILAFSNINIERSEDSAAVIAA